MSAVLQSSEGVSWQTKKLGEVCRLDKRSHDGAQIPYLGMEDIEGGTGVFLGVKTPHEVRSNTFDFTSKHVLYGRLRPYLNKVLLPDFNGHCSTEIFPILPGDDLDRRYLFYWLIADEQVARINSTCTGARMPRANFKEVLQFSIPVPPLPEQERIVAILDEAFEGIATATAHAQRNLDNARELFQSVLQSTFEQKGEDWVETTLNNVCQVERGSSPRPIKQYLTTDSDGVNWIKIGDTKVGTKYVTETKQKITREGAKKSRFVKEGDLILTNSMTFGNPFIVKMTGYIHDGWFVLRLGESLYSEFSYYLLSSPLVREQFDSLAAGAVVKNISSDLVKRAVLPIPPLNQQKTIVQKLDALSAETRRLEAVYQRKLAALAELKQSLLQRAFAGEL